MKRYAVAVKRYLYEDMKIFVVYSNSEKNAMIEAVCKFLGRDAVEEIVEEMDYYLEYSFETVVKDYLSAGIVVELVEVK